MAVLPYRKPNRLRRGLVRTGSISERGTQVKVLYVKCPEPALELRMKIRRRIGVNDLLR